MSRRTLVRIAVGVLVVAVVVGIYVSPLRAHFTRDNVRAGVEQLRGAWYGPLVFIGVFALGCVLAVPASVFVVSAGFIWGWVLGGTYSILGGMLGAVVSFYIARFVGEGLLDRFGRMGRMVAKQVDHAGFRSLLILRNIPGIPFAVLNYGAGVAGVRLVDFLLATAIGMAPTTFALAWCADSLFNGTMTEGDVLRRIFMVAGVMLAVVLLPLIVKRLANRTNGTDGTSEVP